MGDLKPFLCQGCGDRFDDEHALQLHIAKHGLRDEQGNRVLPLRSVEDVMDRVELAAQQARKLGEDIGMDARSVDELEQKVRASAAIDGLVRVADEHSAAVDGLVREQQARIDSALEADWRCEKCGGTDPDIHCNSLADTMSQLRSAEASIEGLHDLLQQREGANSVLDQLEQALRDGAVLDVAATPFGGNQAFHGVMETADGGKFASAAASDLIGCLLALMEEWKQGKPKPPPCCLKCGRELTAQLIGQHMNIEHGVPWCIPFANERTRTSCIPPDAPDQLLQAAIRKQKAVQS